MTAVRTGAIRPVNDLIVTRPGPRLVEGLRELALAIHPDLVLPSAAPIAADALTWRLRGGTPRPASRRRVGRSRGIGDRPALLVGLGLVALVVALIAGVGLGSVAVAPGDTVAILAHRLLGLDLGPHLVGRDRDDRDGAAPAAGPHGDARRLRAWPSPARRYQGLLRNPLADPYVLGTASGAALGAAIAVIIPVRVVVLEFGLLHGLAFVGALAVDLHGLPAVADQRAGAADQPAADRLRGRVAPGGRAGDGDVPVGRRAPSNT